MLDTDSGARSDNSAPSQDALETQKKIRCQTQRQWEECLRLVRRWARKFTLPESPIVVERNTVRSPERIVCNFLDLKSCFTFRACVMRTVPHIMKGIQNVDSAELWRRLWRVMAVTMRRGWQEGGSFLLFAPRKHLEERVRLFHEGHSCWNRVRRTICKATKFQQEGGDVPRTAWP